MNDGEERTISTRRRNTQQKKTILDALIQLGSHVSAGEIYKELAKTHPQIGRATVFRVLSEMADDGKLLRISTSEWDTKFDITTRPHFHIICRKCGKVSDVEFSENPDVIGKLSYASGYRVEEERVELIGLCPDCTARFSDSVL